MARKKKLMTKDDIKSMLSDPKSRKKIEKYSNLQDFMQDCDVEAQHYIMTFGIYMAIEAITAKKED